MFQTFWQNLRTKLVRLKRISIPLDSLHPTPFQSQHLELELIRLNQELANRAQEQTTEMARLNVELQLQMARHKQAEEIAHANEERFRNMAENIQEGLTILESGRLIYVNKRACEIFGNCPEGEILNRIHRYAIPQDQDRLVLALKGAIENNGFPLELEYWITRQDSAQQESERRCVREYYASSSFGGGRRIFIVSSDITEKALAYQILESTVQERTRELSTVLDVSRKIASTLELEPLLHLILDQIKAVIPHIGSALFTLEEDRLTAVAYHVPGLPAQDQTLSLSLAQAGRFAQVVREKKVVVIDDIEGDTPLARALRESSNRTLPYSFEHAHSWIGIPLVVRDQVTGLLSLAHEQPNFYTQRHARLAITITNQVAVAIENARLYEKAQNLAVIEERHRIARELHDSVTQLLYGICLYCTATSRSVRSGNLGNIEANLAEIKDDALQALREMRLLILELDPPMLQKAGLAAALQASLEVIETRTGLETELKTELVNRLPRLLETELYRIAIEALNNLVRYAHAKKITVELRETNGHNGQTSGDKLRVSLAICDNGVGFDLIKAKDGSGMGLHNMEQRARQIGGELIVTSSLGAGTRILVEAPIENHAISTLN